MTPRQREILRAIVELYAKTAEPVGSSALAEAFETSSATVRSEMAELERLGLIMQPHISAGRVPTDKGYRAYVNAMEAHEPDTRHEQALARRVNSAGEPMPTRSPGCSIASKSGWPKRRPTTPLVSTSAMRIRLAAPAGQR
jgi:transcriptional regulator of heat shock response